LCAIGGEPSYNDCVTRTYGTGSLVRQPPKEIRGYAPIVSPYVRRSALQKYEKTLSLAKDERPMQRFFEENPAALLVGILRPHTGFVLPRQMLPTPGGGGWIPDFMVVDFTSIGPQWQIVELESPVARVTTSKGLLSAKLRTAQQQIEDYRRHLGKYAGHLRDGGFPIVDGHCHAWIVAGRRKFRNQQEEERLADFRKYNIEIVSYDRLADEIRARVKGNEASARGLRRLLRGLNS